MNLLLLIAGFSGIAALDLPGMIKNRQWRSLVIYSMIFLLVFVLGMLIAFDVKIPSPIKAIQAFYRDVLHLSFKIS